MKKEAIIFVKHILENIEDIETFSEGLAEEDLKKDKLRQKAIVRSIEIIGEAVKNIPQSFREKYPDIPWKSIAGTRDKIIHHYFGIDLKTIWDVIKKEIPSLKKKIKLILKKESTQK